MKQNKTIIIGIGNSGRQDDGLGWLFLDHLQKEGFENTDLEYRYQLQIEDAELICNYDTVIFVDAVKKNIEKGYYFKPCKPSAKYSFSTHELTPETILYLASNLYQHDPESYILGIEGLQWELKTGLCNKAKINLQKAMRFFTENLLTHPSVIEVSNQKFA